MSSKPLSEYVKEAKEKRSDLSQVMEKRKELKLQELDDLQLDRYIQEERAKLQQYPSTNIPHTQAVNWVGTLFAGRSPSEIQEIVNGLTPEGIDKLAMINARMNPANFATFRDLVKEPTTEAKTVLEAVKTGVEVAKGQSTSTSDSKTMLEAMKLGIEVGKTHNPSPQSNMGETLIKETLAELRAQREENARKDQLRLEKEIAEIKMRPSAMDEIARDAEKFSTYRKMFGGTDSATANEYTLKKLEMEQTERLEDRKIGFEEKKWEFEKASEGKTIEQVKDLVKTVTEGPVGDVLKSFGEAGADRIRGSPKRNTSSIIQVTCPNCQGKFQANDQLAKINCPLCGAELAKAAAPAPQPTPTAQATEPEPKPQEPQENQSVA